MKTTKTASTLMELTESQRNTLVCALRVAAERYKEHADFLRNEAEGFSTFGNRMCLGVQFVSQAADAKALSDLIEGSGKIVLHPDPD